MGKKANPMTDSKPEPQQPEEAELKEKLAAIEHERWSSWQEWCHKILRDQAPSPELEKVLKRWDKQIATDYYDLNDREKDADMEQVDRYWPLIETYIANRVQAGQIDELSKLYKGWFECSIVPLEHYIEMRIEYIRKGDNGVGNAEGQQ